MRNIKQELNAAEVSDQKLYDVVREIRTTVSSYKLTYQICDMFVCSNNENLTNKICGISNSFYPDWRTTPFLAVSDAVTVIFKTNPDC